MKQLQHYGDELTTEQTNAVAIAVCKSLAKRIQSLTVRELMDDLLDRRDYRGLCDHSPDYEALAHNPADASLVRQIQACFQKRDDLDLGIDRLEVAFQNFLASETLCFETNTFFKALHRGSCQTSHDVNAWLFYAQRKIADILGEVPPLEQLRFRFGPGSTTARKLRDSHPRYKLGDRLACSGDLTPILQHLLEQVPSLSAWDLQTSDEEKALVDVEIHDAKLAFVPKNYKTFRGICIEPSLNLMYQLGFGDYIADRLKCSGVDITDQTRNQNLAKIGSVDGLLATVDLSSASDTIATELVASLL